MAHIQDAHMQSHRIGILSDTHGLLRPEILEKLKTCAYILHAGDVDRPDILSQLEEICPTYAVRGNADKEWAEELPVELKLELFGFRIYMVHNKKHIPSEISDVTIIIYGHSHKYEVKQEKGITLLNPGSCGPRRFHLPVTMMILTLYPQEHRFEIEKVDCSPAISQKSDMKKLPEKDMERLIREIIKEIRSGRTVEEIAAGNRIDRELADQICRIYLTHPGVDVDGILARMEIWNL